MKKKDAIMIMSTYIVACLVTAAICISYYKGKLYEEFKRGLFTGIEYHSKHGVYPSYWHWNKKFENPDFNIDTIETYQSRTGDVILRTEPFIFPDSFHDIIDTLVQYEKVKPGITMEEIKKAYKRK